jgi:hypothetical protein
MRTNNYNSGNYLYKKSNDSKFDRLSDEVAKIVSFSIVLIFALFIFVMLIFKFVDGVGKGTFVNTSIPVYTNIDSD